MKMHLTRSTSSTTTHRSEAMGSHPKIRSKFGEVKVTEEVPQHTRSILKIQDPTTRAGGTQRHHTSEDLRKLTTTRSSNTQFLETHCSSVQIQQVSKSKTHVNFLSACTQDFLTRGRQCHVGHPHHHATYPPTSSHYAPVARHLAYVRSPRPILEHPPRGEEWTRMMVISVALIKQ